MADVRVKVIDEMEPLYDGIARRARAELGVTGWGMQVMTLPPEWGGYPYHAHGAGTEEDGQEEVYIPLSGSATLIADEATFDLYPGVMARVGPAQRRKIVPGPQGIRFVALGGRVGAHTPSPWTELGGPWPIPAQA
jgi:mannose-6-phosphate isomerase-like protein (cupin superfamily)